MSRCRALGLDALVVLWWLTPAMALAGQAAGTAVDCTPGSAAVSYTCAVASVERQEFAPAIRTLEQLLQREPRDLKALNLLGIALTGAGRVDEARARFEAALAIDATFYPALKNLAINEFSQGRLTEAQQLFEAVLARAPADEITHLHLGEIAFQRQQYGAALPHYEKSHDRIFQNPTWTLHYATCLLDAGQREAAVAALDRLPADDASSRFEAGVALGRAGAHADAARLFESARNGFKDPYAAGYNEALMLVEAERYDEAIGVANGLIARGMKPAELYNLIARAQVGAGRIQEAYDALRTATRIEPEAEDNYLDLAAICLDHRNYDLGLEILGIGLQRLPRSFRLQLHRGVLLIMKGLVAEGQTAFDAARALAPDSPTPYVALAMAWMQTNQTPKAVDMLRTRAHAGRSDATIHYMLGVALMRAGASPDDAQGKEAAEAFASAVRLQPDFAQARAELGKLLLKQGDVPGAIVHLEKAVALEPDRAGPAYTLAQAYRRRAGSGDTERARALLARVSTLNARDRGDDPDSDLKRTVLRIVRETNPGETRP